MYRYISIYPNTNPAADGIWTFQKMPTPIPGQTPATAPSGRVAPEKMQHFQATQWLGDLTGKNRWYTLWLFNIAMENGPFIDGLPIKNGDFP